MTTPFLVTTPDHSEQHTDLYTLCSQSPYTLLYFYPKDNTSGCSLEAQNFNTLLPEFKKYGVQIVGVSKDSHKSHCTFQANYGLQISLVADTEHVLIEDPRFDAWKEKSMYGRKYMGVARNTFLLDTKGQILYQRLDVKPATHAHEVLAYIEKMGK